MRQKEIAYQRIYQDFQMRLCEGEFSQGSLIPSTSDLCKQYSAARNTILTVIKMLKENGFIATSQGKPAQVVFDHKKIREGHIAVPNGVFDKEILQDYYKVINILFPSIYTHASLSCTEEQRVKIEHIVSLLPVNVEEGEKHMNLLIRFFQTVITSVDNQVLVLIIKTVMQKTILPATLLYGSVDVFTQHFVNGADTVREIYDAIEKKDSVLLKSKWRQLLANTQTLAEKALTFNPCLEMLPPTEADLFQTADEGKSFLIAYDFRRKISTGSYEVGDYLPSLAESTKHYEVSKITIVRAYQILGEMGLTKTTNGRGTHVVQFFETKNSAYLKKMSESHKRGYLDTIIFLEITFEDVLCSADNISFDELRDGINGRWNPAHRYSLLILLSFICKAMDSPAFTSILDVALGWLYWGIYVSDIPAFGCLCEKNHVKCLSVIDSLEREELPVAITLMRELIDSLHPCS